MTNFQTTYLGLSLPSPIVVSSIPMNGIIESLLALEAAGAGAVILPSLFQEQLDLEDLGFVQFDLESRAIWPDHLKRIPNMTDYNRGVAGYLNMLWKLSRAVDIPLIASLNATSPEGIERYARLLASAGAAAIELNIYNVPTEKVVSAELVEARYIRLVQAVCDNVTIPVSVKLHPYFSSLPNIVMRMVEAGAAGVTLFNRFFQPDVDLDKLSVAPHLTLSDSSILRKRLRWVALLDGVVDTDYAITGGVHSAEDALKALLVGSSVAMVASAVIKGGPETITTMLNEMEAWMTDHDFDSVDQLRGKLSAARKETTAAFMRANYINELFSYEQAA